MSGRIAVLFPGQGSQYVGMVREFLETDDLSRELMAQASEASGLPLEKLCLEGPMEEMTKTLHLQPLLTAVDFICWRQLERAGVRADFFCGHSLGEYPALMAAGVLDPRDGFRLVTERGRLMEREALSHPGSMQAVVKLSIEEVRDIVREAASEGVIGVANHNSAQQVVISGEEKALQKAAGLVKERGGKAIPLKVSGPWHSELIAGAIPDFTRFMEAIPFAPPRVPVLFNVTAAAEEDPRAIKEIMARQIASAVRWYEIVGKLLEHGVTTFIEAGPKEVLSGLVRKIVPRDFSGRILQVDNPATLDAVRRELGL